MKRVKLASIEADTVPEGHYRRLDPSEVAKLSRAIDRALENKPHRALTTDRERAAAVPK